jgi:hypothetical protein
MKTSHLCVRISLLIVVAAARPGATQQVTHVHPACWTPGQTQRVSLFGSQLLGVKQLWMSCPGRASLAGDVAPTDTTIVFDVFVEGSAPAGIEGCRAVGETAMSEVKLVVLDTMPRTVETGNNVASTPQKLTLPMSVSGFILPEETDYYSVDVVAGQRATIEVIGHRLGTGLDPLVRIVGPDGREFLVQDNDDGLDYDCRFPVVFSTAGTYRIEVRDARFQGGLWPYVLRIGDFPSSRVGYPAHQASANLISLLGPANHETAPLPASARSLGKMSSILAFGKDGPAWITIAAGNVAGLMEIEPNNSAAQANAFELGRPIEGRLEYPGDVDAYCCRLTEPRTIFVRSTTRRFGSPADLYLRVLDAGGNEVLSADDQGDDDAELSYAAPAAGTYTLLVEDLNRRGGAEFVYHLETFGPRDEVIVRPGTDRVIIPRGTAMPIPLAVERHQVGEPLTLSMNASPAGDALGVRARPGQIDANAGSGVMVLEAAPEGVAGTTSAELVASWGKSDAGALPRMVGGWMTPLLRPKLEQITLFPPSLETALSVAVVDAPFFRLAARPAVLARYLSGTIEIAAIRDKFAEETIAISVENLPANVTAAAASMEKGKRTLSMTLESKPGSGIGSFPIWVTGTSSFAGRTVRVASEVVMLVVRPAVTLTVASPEVTIEVGKKLAVIVKGDRLGGATVPLGISWMNLPAGISAAAATIAEGQSEVAVELSAEPTTAVGTYEGIVARSTYTVNGQQETVDSMPIRLKVVPAAP